MIEFGKVLREAREAKGLTVAQLAERTHMTAARVEELEAENFTNIPAAIYGRGFVRLYCNTVGLDPKPLCDEFTEIFNGNRDIEIRERPSAPEPPPAAEPIPAAEPAPADVTCPPVEPVAPDAPAEAQAARPEPIATPEPIAAPEPITAPEPPPPTDLFGEPLPHEGERLRAKAEGARPASTVPPSPATATAAAPTLSRYAAPLRERPQLAIPPSVWRLALLGSAALLLLWGLLVGVRALYRATSGTGATEETTAVETPPETTGKPTETPAGNAAGNAAGKPLETPVKAAPAAPRTPQKIPELYLD